MQMRAPEEPKPEEKKEEEKKPEGEPKPEGAEDDEENEAKEKEQDKYKLHKHGYLNIKVSGCGLICGVVETVPDGVGG